MKEIDIRPDKLFDIFIKLCSRDAEILFSDCLRTDIPCPGCGHDRNSVAFDRWGFAFATCDRCGSLFQTPRPEQQRFFDFYCKGESAHYWSTVFLPAMEEQRREHLFAPKAQELKDLCDAEMFSPQTVVDVGAGFGLLLEEWRRLMPETRAVALEPNPEMAKVCRDKGLDVVEAFAETAEGLQGVADLATSFEVLEHAWEPLSFCTSIRKLLRPGGKALFTTLTSSGFDIQILWDRSKAICPPQHINFLTIEGLERLMKRAGFKDVMIFTPGKLDVDIIFNAIRQGGLPGTQRYVVELLKTEERRAAFQRFLQEHNMSSHCWVWASN